MRFAFEVRFGLLALFLLQLITSFAAIGLLARMSPAVENILVENVYSMDAVDDMFVVVVNNGPTDAFVDALERARNNVTEKEETALIAAIEAHYAKALAGDVGERAALAGNLSALAAVNRASMDRADLQARQLGWAGAWATVLLGFASFVVTLVVFRRQEDRLVTPILDLHAAIESAVSGDPYRRVRIDGPIELQCIGDDVNRLLDARAAHAPSGPREARQAAVRQALHLLIDVQPGAAVVGTDEGEVLACHVGMVDVVPKQIAEAVRADALPEGWTLHRSSEGTWLALRAAT